ncbi:MAG: hypothetical protein ABI193_22690 [Minicystis sp.]
MALFPARALLPLLAIALLPACAETPPREITPWATAFPVQGSANINALSVDAYSGSVALAGTFSGSMDFGTGPLESYFGSDIFVAQLGDTGKPGWGGHTGGSPYLGQQGVAVAPNGDVIATGMFTESIGFGGTPLKTTSQSSYLVRFDAAGTLLWQQKLGTDSNVVTAAAVAVDSEGNAVIAGSFTGEASLGGFNLVSPGQSTFIAKYDASGNPIFGHAYGGSGHAAVSVACDTFGNTVIYGRNNGDLYVRMESWVASGNEAFVAKIDRQGSDLWAIEVGSLDSYLQPSGLALSPSGEAVITGAFYSGVSLGALEVSAVDQNSTAFVGKLSADGKPLWLKALGGNGPSGNNVNAVAVGGAGDIYVTGSYSGEADLGTGPLPRRSTPLSSWASSAPTASRGHSAPSTPPRPCSPRDRP